MANDDQTPKADDGELSNSGALRLHDRYPVAWHAKLSCPDWQSAERIATANVSPGGMFVRTDNPPDLGQRVEIMLELPNSKQTLIKADVRHVVPAAEAAARGLTAGIGVEVTKECRAEMAALAEIARMRQGQAPTAAAAPATPPPTPAADVAPPPPPPPPPTPAVAAAPPRAAAVADLLGGAPDFEGRQVAGVIGIDFGVSYCSAAVAVGDTVHPIADDEGRTLFPSVVAFPEQSPSRIVGWAARRLQLTRPDRTLVSVKRIIGRNYSDPAVGGYLHSAPFRAQAGPEDSILLEVDGESYAAIQICAELLTMIRDLAEKRLGRPVTKAVLNTPIAFGPDQRKALVRAAKLARIDVTSLAEEPLASAMAHRCALPAPGERVVVYDFGGGTFDFTVLDMSGAKPRLLASRGDAWLGGDDFDNALADAVANAFWRRTEIQIQQRAVEWQRLLFACEQTKRRLSSAEEARVEVKRISEGSQPVDLVQPIDRPTFQRVCMPLLHRSLEVCHQALGTIKMKPEDATSVVVSGGTTRIPFIRDALERYFKRKVETPVSPDHAVSLGCAVLAAEGAGHAVTRVASPPEA